MRFAIMESVVTPGGHEIDFDRILVEELSSLRHTVEFYVPERHRFKWDYGVPVHTLQGKGISYQGARGMKKFVLSARRELHRQYWYRDMYHYACAGKFDAIIFPSATYRYLRALKISPLKHSPVPVLFLIHGLTPDEAKRLDKAAEPFAKLPNIRIGVQTFARNKLHLTADHLRIYSPPNYIPRDIHPSDFSPKGDTIILGFFGQYRREKNLKFLLDAFLAGSYTRPVCLFVQGATQTKADREDFDRLIRAYEKEKTIQFLHEPLIGMAWQKALASVSAIVIPYGNERYRYHTSAMISNAIGYKKPVLAADNVNPEVLAAHAIGVSFPNGDSRALTQALEKFVNTYEEEKNKYASALDQAYTEYAPSRLAENIVALASDEGRDIC